MSDERHKSVIATCSEVHESNVHYREHFLKKLPEMNKRQLYYIKIRADTAGSSIA